MARKGKRRSTINDDEAYFLAAGALVIYAKWKQWVQVSWWILAIPLLVIVLILVFFFTSRPRGRKATMNEIDKMTGEQFETTLQYYLKQMGWKVRTTPKTNDFGADLVGTDPNGVPCVIQAKRRQERVRIEGVQQVIGARSYYQAKRALVITNNYLTKSAWELAQKADVEVWNRQRLEKELKRVKK